MKIEKTICDALIKLAKMNPNNCLSEDVIFQYTEQEGLSLTETTRVCKQIEEAGIIIVSQVEYDAAISSSQLKPAVLQLQNTLSVDDIINAFIKLSNSEQQSCLLRIQQHLKGKNTEVNESIRKSFIDRVNRMTLQYSYIAVLLLSFLNTCDSSGIASFESIIESFSSFYRVRHLMGEFAEQPNSVLASSDYTKEDVRKLILYNPLRRSFVADYIKYNDASKCLEINEQLWDELTDDDINWIKAIIKNKLEEYFKKVDPSVNNDCHGEAHSKSPLIIVLHLASKKINASGYYADGKFIVLKGSQMSHTPRASCKKTILQNRNKLFECGQVVDYVFMEDVIFGSPSMAAAVLLGGDSNGWIAWKSEDGKALKELFD